VEIKDILQKLIEFKTIYPNYEEISKCILFIENYYKDTTLNITKFSFNNDKSIFISNTKDKDLDVLFVGHIDVVPADDSDFKVKIIGDKLYGRGSFDMKGHDVVMMKLLKEQKFKNKIGLLLTSDEERGGFNGTGKFLNELKYTCKIAIVPDAGNNFEIIEEEKGVLQIKLSYVGTEAHSSQVWLGDNAIQKISQLYQHLIKKYPLPKSKNDYRTSINIAKIEGGSSTNMVAKESYAILDIRHTANDTIDDILKAINEFNPKIKVEILAQGEPFLTIKDNHLYQHFLNSYVKIIKKKVKFAKCESASDGRFFY
jgi:succinyl-diaminopimelate desuccinylase